MAHKAATENEDLTRLAHHGYEMFHQLPEGSSPLACLANSLAGLLRWAKFMETSWPASPDLLAGWSAHLASKPLTETKTITYKMGDCFMTPDPVGGFGDKLMNFLKPRLNIDLLTRADAPLGISIVAPRDNKTGWELIDITIDLGACDTW